MKRMERTGLFVLILFEAVIGLFLVYSRGFFFGMIVFV